MREHDAQRMLDATCKIAGARAVCDMAWSGLLDAGGRMVVAAQAGATPEALQIIAEVLNTERLEDRCAFTDRAVQTGQPCVCNDVTNDPDAARWREAALKLGYRSMVSLPLPVAAA